MLPVTSGNTRARCVGNVDCAADILQVRHNLLGKLAIKLLHFNCIDKETAAMPHKEKSVTLHFKPSSTIESMRCATSSGLRMLGRGRVFFG